MKKPPVKKLKPIKTMIAQVAKPVQFDLSFAKQEENAKIVVALQSLQMNQGWLFLCQVLEGNAKYLERQIITKRGENGEELTDEEIDLLRVRHSYINELLQTPEGFMKKLTSKPEKENDLDPYEQSQHA